MPFFGFVSLAHAFCGTYVGQAGAELYNNASQVAIARQGTRTTLTLAPDVEANTPDFALVVPVPEVLSAEDVAVVDPAIFAKLDAYSAPRLVSYTCDDFWYDDSVDYDGGDTGAAGEEADDSVTVEAEFEAGEYDVVVLSAEESGALIEWLNDNGYAVSLDAEELLGEYIEAGAYFFAARVALDRVPAGQSWLSPLRFGYESEVFSLPVRIGTLNAKAEQDLLLYVVADYADGAVGISNYPEATVEEECLWQTEGETFGEFYAAQFAAAMATTDRPGWVREYAWGSGACDPCSGEPPSAEDLATIGYEDSGGYYGTNAFFTRIHARWAPEEVDQDLVLYLSNDTTVGQVRYVEYAPELEDRFPVCGVGMVDDPGSCDDTWDDDGDGIPNSEDDDADGDGTPDGDDDPADLDDGKGDDAAACGCGSPVAPAWGLAALAALAARRRR
ncbi:MAG: DUF2330 domain-containing protein [Myxococcota bacterium]